MIRLKLRRMDSMKQRRVEEVAEYHAVMRLKSRRDEAEGTS